MTGNLSMGSQYITGLHDPSISTDAATKGYVDSRPDSTYNASYWTGTNYNSSYLTSTYNATYDAKPDSTYNATYDAKPGSTYNATYDAKAPSVVYGYVTLMSGSAMVTTTNPSTMGQAETTTNKNNYIYSEFTDGGSEVTQWIADMPMDWNSADANNGKLTFYYIWTATSGSGTVKFVTSAKLFPDDAALDTALAAVGDATDTLTATGDLDVSPATSPAVVTSAGSGGQTVIFKVNRDSANDTGSFTARLIGMRIKYIRTLAG